MDAKDPKPKPTAAGEHEHPVLEAFNAEEAVTDPGHPREEPDTASDSDVQPPG